MPPSKTPYQDTSVPVTRSKGQIEAILIESGARGVRFDRGGFKMFDQTEASDCICEFIWPVDEGHQMVRLLVNPLPLVEDYTTPAGRWRSREFTPDQRERQAWRALAWYVESMLKAAKFGLMTFEELFLAFIVDPATDKTVGEVVIPRVKSGALALLEAGK